MNTSELELKYLGLVITENGVKPNPNKIQVVRDFKRPSTDVNLSSDLRDTIGSLLKTSPSEQNQS